MSVVVLLTALIPKLITLLEDEVLLPRYIQEYISTIKRELEYMKAFLMMEENSTEDGNLINKVWVKQVRIIALESEDAVDVFMLHFNRDNLHGSCTCCASVFLSFKNIVRQRNFASRIRNIISRYTEICDSNSRYLRIDLTSSSMTVNATKRWYNPQQDSLFNDDNLVGVETHKRYLSDMLVNDDIIKINNVVSVYGEGGVGKTSLVKKIFDGREIKENFKSQAWITVTRTFEPGAIFINLIQQLHNELEYEELNEFGVMTRIGLKHKVLTGRPLVEMDLVDLQQMAKITLSRRKYLVVLDNIWSIDAWDAIKNTFPKSPGSRVLITTRNAQIALSACNEEKNHTFNLKPLAPEHWLPLFCKKTFNGDPCPESLAEVTGSILRKCSGVPLAILAISGVLAKKDKSAFEWEKTNRNIGSALKNTMTVLSFSYTDLPGHIKPCYLYLSIFPEDYLIHRRRLIRLWIAEGFIPKVNDMTQEELAESYLQELEQRSLIQVVDNVNYGIPEKYRIHDLHRELVIEKAEGQLFATVARGNNHDHENWAPEVRRLSLPSTLSYVPVMRNLDRLRSIFVFEVKQQHTMASVSSLFSQNIKFKLLTVLDLQGTNLNTFPSTILMLANLKYLNLSHTHLESIPSSIRRLRKLETLDLKYTHVTKLPTGILKLQRLRDLLVHQYKNDVYDVGRFNNKIDVYGVGGFKAPEGVECWQQCMHSLLFVDAGSSSGNVAEQIGMLTQLRRLGITNSSIKNMDTLCSSISKLHQLRVLFLSLSESEEQAMDLHRLISHSNSLGCLYLTGKLESLPQRMPMLQNLERLFLRSSKLLTDPLETLGQLPSLVQLELVDACTTDVLHFKAGGMFGKLKILGLYEFKHVVQILLENGTMPELEWFRMVSFPKLKMVPEGIIYLSKLSVLDIIDMPSDILAANDSRFEDALQSIREVNWIYKDENAWEIERLTEAGHSRRNMDFEVDKHFMTPNLSDFSDK